MGWPLGAALTAASAAAMRAVYGWVGQLLWQTQVPLHDPALLAMFRIAALAAGACAVLLLAIEAGLGRTGQALAQVFLLAAGTLISRPLVDWLTGLDGALLNTIATAASAGHAVPLPPAAASVVDFLVFVVPYLLLLVFLACLMLARMAVLVTLMAAAPIFFALSLAAPLRRMPALWLGQVAVWSLLPAAEAFLLVLVRGLAGELGLPVPATDMLLGLVILYLMARLPFALLRQAALWVNR